MESKVPKLKSGTIIKTGRTISFPDAVFRDIKRIENKTPGCKFSALVVDLVKRGLDSLRKEDIRVN